MLWNCPSIGVLVAWNTWMVGRSLGFVMAFSATMPTGLMLGVDSIGMGENICGKPSAFLAFGVFGRSGTGAGGRPVAVYVLM